MPKKAAPSVQPAEDEPPLSGRPSWLVALIANVKGETELPEESPPDAGAEFDRVETLQSILKAIESAGHRAVFIPADDRLPDRLQENKPQICFNIAEGLYGDGREAQVPALLEMYCIPYTASRVVANAISLEKTLTKRLWRDAGLPVAPFQEFQNADEAIRRALRYPLFVKPVREGTGMGVDLGAVVHNESEMRKRVDWVIRTYRQPALVESSCRVVNSPWVYWATLRSTGLHTAHRCMRRMDSTVSLSSRSKAGGRSPRAFTATRPSRKT
jgi:D-alanine-D-alanine ligase